jgi:hypothetical protein
MPWRPGNCGCEDERGAIGQRRDGGERRVVESMFIYEGGAQAREQRT